MCSLNSVVRKSSMARQAIGSYDIGCFRPQGIVGGYGEACPLMCALAPQSNTNMDLLNLAGW